jgi:hypothetical protein
MRRWMLLVVPMIAVLAQRGVRCRRERHGDATGCYRPATVATSSIGGENEQEYALSMPGDGHGQLVQP